MTFKRHYFSRAMLSISAAYAVMRCLSVSPSVTFVDSVETNKHIFKICSPLGSHNILVFPHQTPWQYSDGDPLTRASNAGGIGTNRDPRRMSGYRSTTGGMRITATVHRTVYCRDRHVSVNLCLSQLAWTTTTKIREQNRIYLYAAVNLKQ